MVSLSSMPRSVEMTWPPVRMAMSCSISLRRSPKDVYKRQVCRQILERRGIQKAAEAAVDAIRTNSQPVSGSGDIAREMCIRDSPHPLRQV